MPDLPLSTGKRILRLPRTRTLSWSAVSLEFVHLLILALWVGGSTAIASLALPALLETGANPQAVSRTALDLLGRLSLLGCGAGSFLLLTTLLMHLLTLRTVRLILAQAIILLAMTAIAVALQIWLAPELYRLLRVDPEIFSDPALSSSLERFQDLFTLYVSALLLQSLLGAVLLSAGVRRWYRYLRT